MYILSFAFALSLESKYIAIKIVGFSVFFILLLTLLIWQIVYSKRYLFAIQANINFKFLFLLRRVFYFLLLLWWYIFIVLTHYNMHLELMEYLLIAIISINIISGLYDAVLSTNIFDDTDSMLCLMAIVGVAIYNVVSISKNTLVIQISKINESDNRNHWHNSYGYKHDTLSYYCTRQRSQCGRLVFRRFVFRRDRSYNSSLSFR